MHVCIRVWCVILCVWLYVAVNMCDSMHIPIGIYVYGCLCERVLVRDPICEIS